jgi:nitroreductase
VTIARDILELARWAPSGDNSQPWRFVLNAPDRFDVFGFDTRTHCVYDLDGWASELSHGMLLETIAQAARVHGYAAAIELPTDASARPLRYRVVLERTEGLPDNAMLAAIAERTVQRRAMRARPLTSDEKAQLESAASPLAILWFETLMERARIAALCARNARIRMTIPEAYAVHRSVIAWRATTSEDRMPDASLGAGPVTLGLMRHAMASFERLDRMNRWTGTLFARLALDFVPGVRCSAQLALISDREPSHLHHRIAAGRAVQRLWLAATKLDLQMQPQYTPLVFARYGREGRRFTRMDRAQTEAATIADDLRRILGRADAKAIWLARIGPTRPVGGRSLRLPLSSLIVDKPPHQLPATRPM